MSDTISVCFIIDYNLALTLIWMVQFQKFKHFPVACNELFHMVHLNQISQIWSFS